MTDTSAKLTLANAWLPASYELDLAINHLKPNFTGHVRIPLKANPRIKGSQEGFSLTLHADRLIITKATVDGVSLGVRYDRGAREVELATPESVANPEVVEIDYVGQINQMKTYQDSTQGLFKTNYSDVVSGRSNNYILATHFQPHAAKLVFPLIEELHIKVPMALKITTLGRFKVASCAPLVSSEPISMSENNVFTFAPTPPMAASVFGFVIGDFEFLERKVSDKPVRVYTAIGESSQATLTIDYIASFLPELEKLFGVAYPLEKLDFVSIPFLNDGAMENWGLVTVLNTQLLMEPSAPLDSRVALQQLVAHELVHMWMGDLVTFDNWNQLWFNEAFATWVGNYVVDVTGLNKNEVAYCHDPIESRHRLMQQDCFYGDIGEHQIPPLIHMNKTDVGLNSLTATLFNDSAYEKGMTLIEMVFSMYKTEKTAEEFFTDVGKVLEAHRYSTIKVFDLWQGLNNVSVDVPTFCHAWSNAAGFPLVSATVTNDKVVIEQHRFLQSVQPQTLELEDTPFHVPLLVTVLQDSGATKTLNIVMSDRKMELDIPPSHFLGLNGGHGYYRVHYAPELLANITANISKASSSQLLAVLHDYATFFEDAANRNVTANDVLGFLHLVYALTTPAYDLDYLVVRVSLQHLEKLHDILLHFSPFTEFGRWIEKFTQAMYDKMGHWDAVTSMTGPDYSPNELIARNSVLLFGIDQFQAVGKTMYKNFTQAGKSKKFTSRYLVSSMLNLYMHGANAREYKDVLELVKNANVSGLNHADITKSELQTMAVSSLGFVSEYELLNKTLNFVNTNIDSKLIELGLIGFRYKASRQDKEQLWNWYKFNYNKWVGKSLQPGSDWAKQIKITLNNISKLVLGTIMNHDPEFIRMRKEFIKEKLILPEHGLKATLDAIDNEDCEALAALYPAIIAGL
ncbi:protein Tma108p [Diutina catenulata]